MMIRENQSLLELNTFHLNVHARFYAEVDNEKDVRQLLDEPLLRNQPKLVLGGGSNILFTGDYQGFVIRNNFLGITCTGEDNGYIYVKSGAGEVWHRLVQFCIGNGYAGIENLSLIPGSVGAGPIQNIGAYGVELKDVFHELSAMDLESGEEKLFTADECGFGYRNSVFKQEYKNRLIITSVTLRLNKTPVFNTRYGAIEEELKRMQVKEINISNISEAVCNIRRSKLPDPALLGNCGSFFKNPEVTVSFFENLKKDFPGLAGYETPSGNIKIAAGWMIEQCGWKGKKVGHTGSHKDQALVLVNYGGATGNEIVDLSRTIQDSVFKKFGVTIEPEVNII